MMYSEQLKQTAMYRGILRIIDLAPGEICAYEKQLDLPAIITTKEEDKFEIVKKGYRIYPDEFRISCKDSQAIDNISNILLQKENEIFVKMLMFAIKSGIYKDMPKVKNNTYIIGARAIRAYYSLQSTSLSQVLKVVDGSFCLWGFPEEFLDEKDFKGFIVESLL